MTYIYDEKYGKELERKGWVEVSCSYQTEKCCEEYCEALVQRPELKEMCDEEIEETKEMVNCPFQKEG